MRASGGVLYGATGSRRWHRLSALWAVPEAKGYLRASSGLFSLRLWGPGIGWEVIRGIDNAAVVADDWTLIQPEFLLTLALGFSRLVWGFIFWTCGVNDGGRAG